jgi:hypothetical protein
VSMGVVDSGYSRDSAYSVIGEAIV